MIKAILWDNDGVLVDTEHLYCRATIDVLATVGVSLSEDQYRDLFLVQSRGAWHLAAERGVPPDEVIALRDRRNDRYAELLVGAPLVMDGVVDTLGRLQGHYAMGIVTSSRRDHFDIIHASTGLLRYFDFAITADDFTHSKPHPEPYLKALSRTGLTAGECIAIEDSERGLTAAKSAGVRCIVIPTPITRASNFSAADLRLPHITGLPAALATFRS